VFRPEEAGKILHPFEVADRDTTGVGQHVGHDQRALVGQDVVGFRSGGAVGAFDDDLGLDLVGVAFVDLAFKGCGNQDVGVQAPEFVGRQRVGVGSAGHAAGFLNVLEQTQDVQAVRVVNGAGVVLHRDDLGACLGEQTSRRAPHVTETLHTHARALNGQAMVVRGGAADHVHAAAGGFHAAQTAADGDGLAGDHAGGGAAVVHGVGVHHPGHGLRVGVDIGSGNILVRPDDHANFAGVAARNALELCTGVVARVDADAAFG